MITREQFAQCLQQAVVGAFQEFRDTNPFESPYAFAIILGQVGNYLGYASATEEGLRRTALEYQRLGYRYQSWAHEECDQLEKLAAWLRWANPDDGWRYGEFPSRFQVQPGLHALVAAAAFGEDATQLEEFCTEVLSSVTADPRWQALQQDQSRSVIVGVTAGEDPRDFLRTATRCNPYSVVEQLWAEHWQGDEFSSRIHQQRDG